MLSFCWHFVRETLIQLCGHFEAMVMCYVPIDGVHGQPLHVDFEVGPPQPDWENITTLSCNTVF